MVGIYSGMNVRRSWIEVPWLTMYKRPGWFGGRDAVRKHAVFLGLWVLGLCAYGQLAVLLASYAAVPGLARVYPVLGQSVPPHIGLGTEVLGSLVASMTAWGMATKTVGRKHKKVRADFLDITDGGLVDAAPKGSGPRLRTIWIATNVKLELVLDAVVYGITGFYEHLWQRDGAILSGAAIALLSDFGQNTFRAWHLRKNGAVIGEVEVYEAVLKVIRLHGYYEMHTELVQSLEANHAIDGCDKRRHSRTHLLSPLPVDVANGTAFADAQLVDYSQGGAGVRAQSDYPVGSRIRLQVFKQTFDMMVVYCDGQSDSGRNRVTYRLGLRCATPYAGVSLCKVLGNL